jgi:hypothetical protein
MYSVLILLFASAQTIFLSQYFYRMYLVGMWTKSSLISAIYRSSAPRDIFASHFHWILK